MNKKVFWFLLFLVVGAISCWATASSFHLMMPAMPLIAVWGIVIVFFILASWAVKMIVDAINNDGSLDHPKAMFWGGIILLIFTWVIISLPTNAHTFFYKLKIGDVVTDDLKSTKVYTQQIKDKVVVDSAYFALEQDVMKEWSEYEAEVISGNGIHGSGIGEYANRHVTNINEKLGAKYTIPTPPQTNGASKSYLTDHLNMWKDNYLKPALAKIMHDNYQVSDDASKEAAKDLLNITAMEDSLHQLILTNHISDSDAEPIIKQAEGVLVVAYTNIKSSNEYVKFQNKDDQEQYTADPIETKTTRFLNPYAVAWDYFTGKIPFTFTFWLLFSILVDVAGFFCFDKAMKKEFDF